MSIDVNGLEVTFGATVAVKHLDLHADHGEFLVVLGPSGSGKTTVLRVIAGLAIPTAGNVRIDGRDVTGLYPSDRNVAMVFQNYALYPHMNVFDNIALNLKMRRIPREEIVRRVEEVSRTLKIDPLLGRKPRQLSGGEAQRVGLARAMVREPAVYLMDEPLSNLDAKLRAEMKAELKRFHELTQRTVIYVTHDQNEAMGLGDRIVVMDRGEKVQEGTPEAIYDRPDTAFVAGFVGSPPMNLVRASATSTGSTEYSLVPEGGGTPFRVRIGGGRLPATVRLGLRARALRPDPSGAIEARFDYSELLGNKVEAHVRIGSARAICEVPRAPGASDLFSNLALGAPLRFAVDPAAVHLFDGESGARLSVPVEAVGTG